MKERGPLKPHQLKTYLNECFEKGKQLLFHPNSSVAFREFSSTCYRYKRYGLLPLHTVLSLINLSHLHRQNVLTTFHIYFFFRLFGVKIHYFFKKLESFVNEFSFSRSAIPQKLYYYLIFTLFLESLLEESREKSSYYEELLNRSLLLLPQPLFLNRFQLINLLKRTKNPEDIKEIITKEVGKDLFMLFYLGELLHLWEEQWFQSLWEKHHPPMIPWDVNQFQNALPLLDSVFSFHRAFLLKLFSSEILHDLHKQYQEVTNLMLEVRRLRQYQQHQVINALQLIQSLQPPPQFKSDRFLLFYRIIPASEVGGDFFDYYYDSEKKRLHFILMDVCGHGLQSAIFVTTLKSHFQYYVKQSLTPSQLLNALSSSIQHIGSDSMFVCFHYGIYDEKSNTLKIWGGGLPEILIFSPNQKSIRTIPLRGIPLGLPFPMENDLITLSPASNDILILLSDGVIEEEDIHGNVIGYQAILHHLQKNQLKTPHEIINQIPQFIKMKTQSESFHDDLSIVAIQFL